MATRHGTDQTTRVPRELARSAPRPVRLTAIGRLVAALGAALALGAAVAFFGLLAMATDQQTRAAALAAEGRRIEARVTEVRKGDGSTRTVRYRYSVAGEDVSGSVTLRARDGYSAGDPLTVVYLPGAPREHYVETRGLRTLPFWVVPLVPLAMLGGGALAIRELRAQRRLVEYGRPAVGVVTGAKKLHHQYGNCFKVSYEFTLMSGAVRRGSYDVQKHPPEPGAPVLVLYDRDHPARNKRYPLSLARARRDA